MGWRASSALSASSAVSQEKWDEVYGRRLMLVSGPFLLCPNGSNLTWKTLHRDQRSGYDPPPQTTVLHWKIFITHISHYVIYKGTISETVWNTKDMF